MDFTVGDDQYANGFGVGTAVFISSITIENGGGKKFLLYELDWKLTNAPSQNNAYDLG